MIEDEEEEESIPVQISPVFKSDGDISNEQFELTFLATVPALGLQTYFIQQLKAEEGANDDLSVASIKIFNSKSQPFQVAPFDSVDVISTGNDFSLSNTYITADFNNK